MWVAQSLRGGVVFFGLFTIAMQIQNCTRKNSYAIDPLSDQKRKFELDMSLINYFKFSLTIFKSKMCKRHDNDFTILLPIEKSKGNNTNIALIYFYHDSSVLSICHFKFSALNHFKHFYLPWAAGVCPTGKVRILRAFKKYKCGSIQTFQCARTQATMLSIEC